MSRIQQKFARAACIAGLWACRSLALPAAVPAAETIKVVTFNVLAPSWASPSYYPSRCVADLDPGFRRARSLNMMTAQMLDADFFMLQETQIDQNPAFASGLGGAYSYFPVYHRNDYWASWITDSPPFARNGVALAVNVTKYDSCSFFDVPLSDDGNHAAMAVCRNKALNRWVRLAAVHLDSDYGGRRGKEARALSDLFASNSANFIDIIAGDLNADTNSGVLQQRITNQGFTDVLRAVGIDENTHPWTTSYNNNSNYGNIDHVLARGSGVSAAGGKIFHSNLWAAYPVLNGDGEPNESARICANLQLSGSDHFPVMGVIAVGR